MTTQLLPSRGDVVLVNYPFSSGGGFERRPALVVQNDRDNARLTTTMVAMITSHTARVFETTQLVIDISTPEGRSYGLHQDSVVICTNLFTIEKRLVRQLLGSLTDKLMSQIDACPKVGLDLS